MPLLWTVSLHFHQRKDGVFCCIVRACFTCAFDFVARSQLFFYRGHPFGARKLLYLFLVQTCRQHILCSSRSSRSQTRVTLLSGCMRTLKLKLSKATYWGLCCFKCVCRINGITFLEVCVLLAGLLHP